MDTPNLPPHSQSQLPNAIDSVSKKPKRVSGRVQAYMVQAFTFDCLVAMQRDLTVKGELKLSRGDAQAVSSIVKAWEMACDRSRITRGKPLPGTLRPKPEKPKRRPAKWPEPTPVRSSEPMPQPVIDPKQK